jgi:hypothetical protein
MLNYLPNTIYRFNCSYNPLVYNFTPTLENIKKYNVSLNS